MTRQVTYIAANGKLCKVTLLRSEWHRVRGVRVLKGEQRINGRWVTRRIAADEIAPNGIKVRRNKQTKGKIET
jgi:hypothetical protein